MKTQTFSGMGNFFPAHDLFATESQGAIQNRAQEHLVSSDKAILAARKLLFKAIKEVQEGRDVTHVVRDPSNNRFPHLVVISELVSSSLDWKNYARRGEAAEVGHLSR
jgi:hypothetical protein